MKIKYFVILAVIFVCAAAITGCGRSRNYGEQISNATATSIKDILIAGKEYDGRAVKVNGRIATECSTGCWFDLKEDGAVIYVDVEPSGFAIPQAVGRAATIEGTVTVKDGKSMITGKGVRIE